MRWLSTDWRGGLNFKVRMASGTGCMQSALRTQGYARACRVGSIESPAGRVLPEQALRIIYQLIRTDARSTTKSASPEAL